MNLVAMQRAVALAQFASVSHGSHSAWSDPYSEQTWSGTLHTPVLHAPDSDSVHSTHVPASEPVVAHAVRPAM
jgi:hypothetical protein